MIFLLKFMTVNQEYKLFFSSLGEKTFKKTHNWMKILGKVEKKKETKKPKGILFDIKLTLQSDSSHLKIKRTTFPKEKKNTQRKKWYKWRKNK